MTLARRFATLLLGLACAFAALDSATWHQSYAVFVGNSALYVGAGDIGILQTTFSHRPMGLREAGFWVGSFIPQRGPSRWVQSSPWWEWIARSCPHRSQWYGSLSLAVPILFFGGAGGTLLLRKPRPRPGLCPHCRYNLTGLPPTSPCPECGKTNQRHEPGSAQS